MILGTKMVMKKEQDRPRPLEEGGDVAWRPCLQVKPFFLLSDFLKNRILNLNKSCTNRTKNFWNYRPPVSIYASSMFYLFKYFVYYSYKQAHSPQYITHHENQEIKPGSLPTSDPQTTLKFGQLSRQCPLQQDGTVQNHTLHSVARSLVRKKVREKGRIE